MHKRVREIIEWAETIGFTNEGIDGQGHYRLRHANGESYSVASTPGDWRGDMNAKAAMRRIAGATHGGPNSGKYRKGVGRSKNQVRHVSQVEVDRSVSVNFWLGEHRRACRTINDVQLGNLPRDAARAAVGALLKAEAALAALGEEAPLRGFRAPGGVA